MPVPLALALPAAAAGLLYIDAKWRISSDFTLIRGATRARKLIEKLEEKHRLSHFDHLEDLALDRDEKSKKRKTSTSEFLRFEGKSWTFKETYDEVLRYASWIHERWALKPRDIVAMDFTNSPEFIFLWFAIWSLGAVPAFINTNLTGEPLIHSIKVSSTRMVLIDPAVEASFSEEVRSGLSEIEQVVFTQEILGEIRQSKPFRAPNSARDISKAHEAAVLIYTSGTTGLPKPAIVSWMKCYTGYSFATNWLSVTRDDRFYTAMPLYHSSASILGLLTALGAACPFILSRRFSVSNFWPEVRENDATIIQYVGETLRYLLSAPASSRDSQNSVRLAFGNGLRPDIWETFKTRFDIPSIAEFYASTEGTHGYWNVSNNSFTSGAVGQRGGLARILGRNIHLTLEIDPVTEQPVRDPNTGLCRAVKPGEKGEVLFNLLDDPARTPEERFPGYFNNPKANASKILRDVKVKGDMWYRTGDIMINDADGRTYFSDRLGDTFRWKSENVSTFEVAEVMSRHPALAEANVYGVQLPHHDGRAGCAAILLKSDHSPIENADALSQTLASLADYLDKNLPRYAVPLFIRVMKEEEMERTGNNKQQKHKFRTQGIDLEKIGEGMRDRVYWLPSGDRKGKAYTKFCNDDWTAVKNGHVRL